MSSRHDRTQRDWNVKVPARADDILKNLSIDVIKNITHLTKIIFIQKLIL